MKKNILAISFVFFFANTFSQSLLPSSIGEVFNLQKGDSFEYRFHYYQLIAPFCSYGGFELLTIDSVITKPDTTIFLYSLVNSLGGNIIPFCTLPRPSPLPQPLIGGSPTWSNNLEFKITLSDSSIFRLYDWTGWPDTTSYTTFTTNEYLGKKQNRIFHGLFSTYDETYLEGVGLAKRFNYLEGIQEFQQDTLIYYQKANAESWGAPIYFIVTGISDNKTANNTVVLSPTPATSSVTLTTETELPAQTYFQLFDLAGRMVLQQPLTQKTSHIDISAVSKGMYLYDVIGEKERLGAGKVILE